LSIEAANCNLVVDRIILRRDVHYLLPEHIPGIGSDVDLPIKLANDEMFVLGDNSQQARDSRYHGPFKTSALVGVGYSIYAPLRRWHIFR
jgi:hypothetical protein